MRPIEDRRPAGTAALVPMPAMNRRRFLRAGLCACAVLPFPACAAQTLVYEKDSLFGRIIVREDTGGLRSLYFEPGGARQSAAMPGDAEHLELAYTRYALAGLALCDSPRRILVVGLGGGTLPRFLHWYYPEAMIDAVEIDPEVADVAKRYFGFRADPRMRVHIGDGRTFVESIRRPSYDVIFLDAYGPDSVPPHLSTQEFLQSVRHALLPGGVAVANVWRRARNPLYDAMVRTYEEVFDSLFIVNVEGGVNAILLALPRARRLSRSALAQRARQISAAKRFRFDLGALVDVGFADAPQKRAGARVLRDADPGPPK